LVVTNRDLAVLEFADIGRKRTLPVAHEQSPSGESLPRHDRWIDRTSAAYPE
jgi:hypothetical protein